MQQMACEELEESGRPITHWTGREIADEVMKRGIVFHYTPNHASWMNQVEIWFSILAHKVLKRGNFSSIDDLIRKVLAFIAYYNKMMVKLFGWTY